jgi:hypothetical protein
MFHIPRNTRHVRKFVSAFRGIDHQHPRSSVRNRRGQVHSNRRRSNAIPGTGNHNHWQWGRLSARLHAPGHPQPTQFFRLIRHYRSIPNNMFAIAPDRAT